MNDKTPETFRYPMPQEGIIMVDMGPPLHLVGKYPRGRERIIGLPLDSSNYLRSLAKTMRNKLKARKSKANLTLVKK